MCMMAHAFWSDFFAVTSRFKPGFHMNAKFVEIAEKKKSSTIAAIIAIIWKPLSSDRSDHSGLSSFKMVVICGFYILTASLTARHICTGAKIIFLHKTN